MSIQDNDDMCSRIIDLIILLFVKDKTSKLIWTGITLNTTIKKEIEILEILTYRLLDFVVTSKIRDRIMFKGNEPDSITTN